jgi:hypothetical protein
VAAPPTPAPDSTSAAAPVAPAPASTPAAVPETNKQQLEVSDEVAQSLLAINGVQTGQPTRFRLPTRMIIGIGIIIAILVIASYVLDGLKPAKTPQSPANSPAQSSAGSDSQSDTGSQDVDNQINQDVNSCQNIVNAVSEC